MPAGGVKTRVSSTCSIWAGAEEIRIRARVLPPLPAALAGLVFGAGSFFIGRDGVYFGAAITELIALGCFCMALSSYNVSADGGGFRTWISLGSLRYSKGEISGDRVGEIVAYSKRAVGGNLTHHYVKLRRNGTLAMPEELVDCWRGSDALAAATALARWLNEHRGAGLTPIVLNTGGVRTPKP